MKAQPRLERGAGQSGRDAEAAREQKPHRREQDHADADHEQRRGQRLSADQRQAQRMRPRKEAEDDPTFCQSGHPHYRVPDALS